VSSGHNINVGYPLISCRLRLAIFKGMGFEPVVEKDGSINKMLVRAYRFVIYKNFKSVILFPLQVRSLEMFISSTFPMAKPILSTLNSFGSWSIPDLYFIAYNELFTSMHLQYRNCIIIKNNAKVKVYISHWGNFFSWATAMMPEVAIE
jgi:hypothetical protein